MFMIAFMFRPGQYDDDFHRLNDEIQAAAEQSDGYVGQETWISPDGRTRNAVYYWNDMGSLRQFGDVAAHRVAKARYREWYEGYQIVISQITEAYGDGRLPHVTSRR